MATHKDVAKKWNHSEVCECVRGFYKYDCNSMFDVSQTYLHRCKFGPTQKSLCPNWCLKFLTSLFQLHYI